MPVPKCSFCFTSQLELPEVADRISAELFGGIPFNLAGFDEEKGGELKADILGLRCLLWAFDPPTIALP